MIRRILTFLCICVGASLGQDLSNIQIHGFVTQGILYSTDNNLFTMETSAGSARWADAAVSLSDTVSDNFRIGIQFRVYQFGQLGGPNLQIDWATGDYRVNEHFRFVAGKVKTVFGLSNDSQDVDTAHLWALLPASIYPPDNKSFLLSHYGGDFYGSIGGGKHTGKLSYRGYVGYRALDLNGGYAKSIGNSIGSAFTTGGGNLFGGDVRWQTPLQGLLVGISLSTANLNGAAPTGSFRIPYSTDPVYFAKFEKSKFMAAGEFRRIDGLFALHFNIPLDVPSRFDAEGYYAMGSYRLTSKFQAGAYYSSYRNRHKDQSVAANFSKDWAISGRYDFNSYFYTKMEGHFIHGTALDYYTDTNPNGLKDKTKLLAAIVGFNF